MIKINTEQGLVEVETDGKKTSYKINTPEAFNIITQAWLRSGWDTKHVYSFTWMGRPLIQLPEDVLRIQEVIYQQQPDVIIETGIAHGGSLIFYASLCKAIGKGRVIGIDIEIRPHNRKAIEEHELFEYITLVEGNSTDPKTVDEVHALVKKDDTVMLILDSNHSKQHVLDEMNNYCDLVTIGSYIIAADGIMAQLKGAPRTEDDWDWNNPISAVDEFLKKNSAFVIEQPKFAFNEGEITDHIVTYWPKGWVKRIK